MNKVAHYLQEHLAGEVMTGVDARKYFSTDGSVFEIVPAIIVYPRNENDVRKTARFTWQLAERGRTIPITARGAGTDQAGAAIGEGIILAFPAHMNKILELDSKSGEAIVEPGLNYGKLQQTLHTHGRFLPTYPSSIQYSTVGGAVGNNAGGEKAIKYGSTRHFIDGLRVVLANGEVIETGRLKKRELKKKLGLSTFEGEIYRALDTLIEENGDLIDSLNLEVTKNGAGYAINEVKRKDGSFDLTPLIVGSQGTLGIISEIKLGTEAYSPHTTLVAALCSDLDQAEEIIVQLRELKDVPSSIEMVDDNLLKFIHAKNPNQLKDVLKAPFPKAVLLIELDNIKSRQQKKTLKKVKKILDKQDVEYRIETDEDKREDLLRIRHAVASVMAHVEDRTGKKAVPIIDDGIVPIGQFRNYVEAVYKLFAKYSMEPTVWGHAGNANLHFATFMNLSQIGDRQKIFRMIEEYYNLVIDMGGSTSGEHNDGRLRAPFLEKLYGTEAIQLFGQIKKIFDPKGTLNPGVKIGVSLEDIKPLLRHEYSMSHLFDFMPRS
jgi:FAD/FMN-containing dehydrogenase